MKTIYLHFINNEYQMRGSTDFWEFDTVNDSDKMMKFLENARDGVKDDLVSLTFEVEDDTPLTDAFIHEIIWTHIDLLQENEIGSIRFEGDDIITIYIDMDNTLVKYSEKKEQMLKESPNMGFPQANYGFFASLEPFEDAVRVIKKLQKHPRFEVMFATAPSIKNPMSYAEKRVCIENLFDLETCEDLIIISKKNKLDDENVFLIDDMESGNGQDKFYKGEHIKYGSKEYPDWLAIEEFFFN